MNKLINWIFESNRIKHLIAGCCVTAASFVFSSLLLGAWNFTSAVFSAWTTLVAATSVEYKDNLWGGKFDVLDILATCISVIFLLIVMLFV